MPNRDGKWMPSWWGDALVAACEREDEDEDDGEEITDARLWLASLFDDKTPKANAETVQWIDEWLAAHLPATT
jgi:hypothetical protein